jgi:hypothetical protein
LFHPWVLSSTYCKNCLLGKAWGHPTPIWGVWGAGRPPNTPPQKIVKSI